MKNSNLLVGLLAASALAAPGAHAAASLLAVGSLNGSSDLSGLSGNLENGLAANVLGGLGSGLAYAGGNTFLALPDRGPNATAYPDVNLDDTVSYINRFHKVSMALTPSGGGTLPLTLTPTLRKTTLLYSASPLIYGAGAGHGFEADGTTPIPDGGAVNTPGKYYFTGRSDNFGSGNSGNPADARFDTESIRLSDDAKYVFISDEYGPYVRQFDRASGKLVKTFTLPSNLDVSNLSPVSNTEISGNTSGRTANKGMEGLAITPDGKTLVGVMQAALIQDAAVKASKKMLRIVTIDITTGATHEYGYMLSTGSGVSDIVALNDHQFLVDERDGSGLGSGTAGDPALVKQLFLIDTTGATDITGLTGAAAASQTMVQKSTTPFLDIVAALGAKGIGPTSVPSKIEGIAFGDDVTVGGQSYHTLWVSNDNDYTPADSGPNNFYVFGFQDSDLPTGYSLDAQQLSRGVPEPATWATMLLGLGVLGGFARRRRGATA